MNSKVDTAKPEVRAGGERGGADVRSARRAVEARKPLKVRRDEEERYFKEAQAWEADRVVNNARGKRMAYIVAGVAVGIAALTSLTSVILATREPPPPVVLEHDSTTGQTTLVSYLSGDFKESIDEIENKFWTEQYVIKREGYLKQTAEENYKAVGLMSCEAEGKRYADWFSPKNPKSPLNVYGDNTKVDIGIVSTTFIGPKLALVRFTSTARSPGVDKPRPSYWAATVGFDYHPQAMKVEARRINPKGYVACTYRVDPDAASEVNSAATQPAAAPAAVPALQQTVQLYPGQPVQVPAPARPANTQGGQ
jgi:type IV secretion system protein VirB8